MNCLRAYLEVAIWAANIYLRNLSTVIPPPMAIGSSAAILPGGSTGAPKNELCENP